MNPEEFIKAIKTVVVDYSVNGVKSILTDPPGRKPSPGLVEMSVFFKNLNEKDKSMVMEIVRESVETSVFGFLCVLDGVRAIEDSEIKGTLNLKFEKGNIQQLINDPEKEYLHSLFN